MAGVGCGWGGVRLGWIGVGMGQAEEQGGGQGCGAAHWGGEEGLERAKGSSDVMWDAARWLAGTAPGTHRIRGRQLPHCLVSEGADVYRRSIGLVAG